MNTFDQTLFQFRFLKDILKFWFFNIRNLLVFSKMWVLNIFAEFKNLKMNFDI